MLVLSRKKGEALVINKDIEIVILESTGSTVKLGIKAPKSIKILRKELIEEVSAENIEAKVDLSSINLDYLIKNLRKD
jgi:carbon storage regulator